MYKLIKKDRNKIILKKEVNLSLLNEIIKLYISLSKTKMLLFITTIVINVNNTNNIINMIFVFFIISPNIIISIFQKKRNI